MTSYYLFGGQRVAMNKGGTLTYLHGDHLGSASIATDGGGNIIADSEMAYKPFGGVLGGGTGLDTPYRFTNQRSDESATGLYDYNARFYSPVLGRFVSADSIVPGAGNPQSLNRYAYVFNNPLRYTDKTGHAPKAGCGSDPIACFLAIQWGDAFNRDGLTADWLSINSAWFFEQQPKSFGSWSQGSDGVPTVTITDMSFAYDLMSRDHFREGISLFKKNLNNKRGEGNAPSVGDGDNYYWKFELPEATIPGKYTELEWFLGSYDLRYSVTAVNEYAGTAVFRFSVVNDRGWESLTRIPGRFKDQLGPSLIINRGGDKTPYTQLNLFLTQNVGGLVWHFYGATMRQIFTWDMIYDYKRGTFSLPPLPTTPKTETA